MEANQENPQKKTPTSTALATFVETATTSAAYNAGFGRSGLTATTPPVAMNRMY